MITLRQELENIIKNKPLLEEGLSKGFINLSALARLLRPKVQKSLYKTRISTAALIMSLKRLVPKMRRNLIKTEEIRSENEITLRYGLTEYTVGSSKQMGKLLTELLGLLNGNPDFYTAFSRGTAETTFIISERLNVAFEKIFRDEKIIAKLESLAAITIRLSEKTLVTPGIYYTFLKALAWDNINLVEIVSNYRELSLIFYKKDIEQAFAAIRSVAAT